MNTKRGCQKTTLNRMKRTILQTATKICEVKLLGSMKKEAWQNDELKGLGMRRNIPIKE